ncbi:hypothetical protein niasHT_031821 [Heterodera trifolii]|uniref:Uncharacterized protein n=1 Tax=Heterodera trifolii TaxID=157864 RepID=A0ABD2HXR5_9BILA
MKSEMAKMTEDIDILRKRIEFLEMEGASDENLWAENGHSFEHEQFLNEDPPNSGENCEIMISDPFLGGIAPLESYDGNPSISFSRWSSKFEDMLSLYPQLTEAQKLSRLRILLIGQARAELESMEPQPENLASALNFLRQKFENENTRSIARQALSICKQAPGERASLRVRKSIK